MINFSIKGPVNLTPEALFPDKLNASQDPKCMIIAEIILQFAKISDMGTLTQKALQEHAAKRYKYLSDTNRITLPDAEERAFRLYQQGIDFESAKKYHSFRLTKYDAERWKIKTTDSIFK